MTAMGWFITADAGEFLAEAGEFLRAEPARNSVVLTVTENLRIHGGRRVSGRRTRLRSGRAVVRLVAAARPFPTRKAQVRPEPSGPSGPCSCTRRSSPSCSPPA